MKMKQGFSMALALLIGASAWSQENNPQPTTSPTPAAPPISTPAPVEDVKPSAQPEAKPAKKKKAATRSKAAVTKNEPAKPDPLLSLKPIGTAVVKNENVNVRGQASFNGEVITKLKKGETVTLLEEITLKKPKKGEPTNWFRISLPTNTLVWVFAEYLDLDNNVIKVPKLNVRAGPGENYSVVARMVQGDSFKQLRKVEDWVEIEAPTNAFAFVAAEFLEKQTPVSEPPPVAAVQEPAPAEVVAVAPAQEVKPALPETPVETPKPIETPAVAAEPTPAPATPPAPVEETPVKRVITREGIVRKAFNIQSPTYFQLESIDSGKLINYLHSPEEKQVDPKTKKTKMVPKIDLTQYVGRRVMVTGEESMDKRWKFTPVIEIETIELQQ